MNQAKLCPIRFPLSWRFVVLFSLLVGIIVGVLDCIPFLKDTSFTDPAVSFEVWILLAIFVIWGSKNTLDATAKCFVFFLISQPVIYLVELLCEVVCGDPFWDTFRLYFYTYYIGAGWLTWTVLTIPGAAIAYQVKRDNVLSALILSVATCGLAGLGIYYVFDTLPNTFPRHLLTVVFCFATAFALCFLLLKKKHTRFISIVLTAVATVVFAVLSLLRQNAPIQCNDLYSLEKPALSCVVEDERIATAVLDDETTLNVSTAETVGETTVHVTFADGTTADYTITVDSKKLEIVKTAS